MAQNFLNIEEAAQRLGISADKLNELRESGELRAFRDGAGWKFKEEEIDRVAETFKGGDAAEEVEELIELDSEADESGPGADSILLSELELGGSDSPSSTVIGKSAGGVEGGSEVKLADDGADSDLQIKDDSDLTIGSDVNLASGASDVLSAGEAAAEDPSSKFEDLDELSLDLEEESSKIGSGSDLGGTDSSLGSSSTLELAAGEDDDLVLGEGSGSGSDISLSSEDSGISIADPSDSGLSLDEPLELGGSAVESLELGEDEEISLDADVVDSEAATQLKADDDFLLTPLDDGGGEDTEDSGSQVIALDSESFDESADTMLGGGQAVGAAVLADELGGAGVAGLGGPSGAAAFALAPQEAPEAPYTAVHVFFLLLCVLMLLLTGFMMYDLIRNMWSWNGAYTLNSNMMDALIEKIPIFQ